jgi:hypothetical protein
MKEFLAGKKYFHTLVNKLISTELSDTEQKHTRRGLPVFGQHVPSTLILLFFFLGLSEGYGLQQKSQSRETDRKYSKGNWNCFKGQIRTPSAGARNVCVQKGQ